MLLYMQKKWKLCKERFYYNFSHLSHFHDGFFSLSLSSLLQRLKGILSAMNKDVQVLHYPTYSHSLPHSLSLIFFFDFSALNSLCVIFCVWIWKKISERKKSKKNSTENVHTKKGDLLDVYIVMFMLMISFWLFYSSPTYKNKFL